MPGMVNVHLIPRKATQGLGQHAHDFRTQVPGYVDSEKVKDNRVLFGKDVTPQTIKDSIFEQSLRIRKATKKAPRKDANFFLSAVISFSKEARQMVNENPPESLDTLAVKYAEDFSSKFDVKLLYCGVHVDESTRHYQFFTENINGKGNSLKNQLTKKDLSALQDRAGEIFAEVGLSRGIKKIERIANGEDYSKTVHRSVKQLHEDLPREISFMENQRDQTREELLNFLQEAPEPEPFLSGGEEVVKKSEFDRFKMAVGTEVALARCMLAGDMVPGSEHRVAIQELNTVKNDLKESKMSLEATHLELGKTKREVGRLRKIVEWFQEYFPAIFDRFMETRPNEESDLAMEKEATPNPGGIEGNYSP